MTPPSGEPATRCLEVDHRNLDAILLQAEEAARTGSFPEACRCFAAFESGLVRHIAAEEDALFPELEQMHPGARGPTSVMRAEHQQMRAMLDRIGAELLARSALWSEWMHRLEELLLAHNTKEERVLYPMADAAAQRTGRAGALEERLRRALAES